jgi:hypothetical protein
LHYLALCYGFFNDHIASAGKNKITFTCTPKAVGYTFVLVQEILTYNPFLPLNRNSTYGTFDTRTPVALFLIGISFSALSLLGFFCCLFQTAAVYDTKIELGLLRPTCWFSILAAIFLVSSTAETTILGKKVGASGDIGLGTVLASKTPGFYVAAWVGATLMLLAFVFSFGTVIVRERQKTRELNTNLN